MVCGLTGRGGLGECGRSIVNYITVGLGLPIDGPLTVVRGGASDLNPPMFRLKNQEAVSDLYASVRSGKTTVSK
jgi:hypothetical protein